jgi:glutamate--cysteine ligase
LADVVKVAKLLQQAANAEGIELLTNGIDPYNDIEGAPLQLTSSRYANMARYFDTIGPAGARMMRQTVAVQVNIALGRDPIRRWRLLNALAAPLIALFANSPRYAGRDTGYGSFRSQVWRETDPARTGVFPNARDPIAEYLDFGLNAPALLSPFGDQDFRPFRDWMEEAKLPDWRAHLTTLFPDVRPKGYFEVRSVDAQPPVRYGALTALVCGVVLDETASSEAERILPAPSRALVERAGRHGVSDSEMLDLCRQLTEIARQGCHRLGEEFLSGVQLEIAGQEWDALLQATRAVNGAGDSSARERLRR